MSLHALAYNLRRIMRTDWKEIVKAVFQVIAEWIDPGEVDWLIKVFPENLQALWVADDAFGWPK